MSSWWNWHRILVWPETLLLLPPPPPPLLLILYLQNISLWGAYCLIRVGSLQQYMQTCWNLSAAKAHSGLGEIFQFLQTRAAFCDGPNSAADCFPDCWLEDQIHSEELWVVIKQNWQKPDLHFRPVKHICQRSQSIEDNFVCRISCCHLTETTIII